MDYMLHAASWHRFLKQTAYFQRCRFDQCSIAGCRHNTAQQHRRKRTHTHTSPEETATCILQRCIRPSAAQSSHIRANTHPCTHTKKPECYHLTIITVSWRLRQIVLLLAFTAISGQTYVPLAVVQCPAFIDFCAWHLQS